MEMVTDCLSGSIESQSKAKWIWSQHPLINQSSAFYKDYLTILSFLKAFHFTKATLKQI